MRGTLFQFDPDIRLLGTEIFLDPSLPRPIAVVSHGHSDHTGRHGRFIATPATAAFLRIREGSDLRGTERPYGKRHCEENYEIELYPAGHVLGSAMVRVESEAGSLLYTGDFRLRPSITAEPASVPRADAVIMEATFGAPKWRFPPRSDTTGRLVETVIRLIRGGDVPVVLAYSLGKAQEICAILTRAEIPVVVHPSVARISEIYEKENVSLGPWEVWRPQSALFGAGSTTEIQGKALVIPPHLERQIRGIKRRKTIAVTGWSLHRPLRTDYAFPFSDHADFDELLELVDLAAPSVVYVTHGTRGFARELRRRGVQAEYLMPTRQMTLF